MEANKIKGEAKSLVLDNGVELTYMELGEQNKEVVVSGAFYFHTWAPVLESLAKKYHVYGIVMRTDGETTERQPNGDVCWPAQWGKDFYEFAQKMGLKQFYYLGKCHGTNPGWWLAKHHPEVLKAFGAFFLAPHVMPANSTVWPDLLKSGDNESAMRMGLRFPESGLKKKMEELASLGETKENPVATLQSGYPELMFDGADDVKHLLATTDVPIQYLFGTEDPLFNDWYDNNIWVMMHTKRSRSVILGGERHLMELDTAERIAQESATFFEESQKEYWK